LQFDGKKQTDMIVGWLKIKFFLKESGRKVQLSRLTASFLKIEMDISDLSEW